MIYTFLNPKGGRGLDARVPLCHHGTHRGSRCSWCFCVFYPAPSSAVNDEPPVHLQHLLLPCLGWFGGVDGRRINYARVRIDTCLVRRELDIVQYDNLRERLLKFHKSLVGQ